MTDAVSINGALSSIYLQRTFWSLNPHLCFLAPVHPGVCPCTPYPLGARTLCCVYTFRFVKIYYQVLHTGS